MKSEFSTKTPIYLRAAELVEMGRCKIGLYRRNGLFCLWEEANQFCYHGALKKAAHELGEYQFDYGKNGWAMSSFNDAPSTTPAMVAAKLREQAFAEGD